MKNLKKLVALGLIGTMVLGSSLTAFADAGDEDAEVGAVGTGANVAIATEVYSITLPTADNIAKLFDFDVDPQGLVAQTAGARYGSDITVGDNTGILFPNYDQTSATWKVTGVSDTSSPLVVTNKSSKGVKLSITCKINKGSATYAGGYSTTPDFSGTGDNATGVYFGIKQTGDLDNYFNETGIANSATAVINAVKSSADQYETKATAAAVGDATSYTYALKTGAEDFATYEFAITGQLNDEMAETTWYTVVDHGVTAKTFGTVDLKFTPSLISSKTAYDKHGVAYIRPSDGVMVIGKAAENGHVAGDLGETAPAAVVINEKGSGFAPATANAAGYGVVLWSEVLTAFGYSGDDYAIGTDNATDLMNSLQTVTFTYGGNKYYADVVVAPF